MKPLLQGHSGTTPEASRNALNTSQGTNWDYSQNDPHPEVGFFHSHFTQNSGPEDDQDMVTGATEQNGNRHDMTRVHNEVTYCSPSTSSEKQKNNRSITQPQFRSEITSVTIEADQVFLVLQRLANNNTSANFRNNINRISKLPKSLTTTMPTFDGKSEKIELFEDLFRTSLKIHNQLTDDKSQLLPFFHEGGCATNI